jgi:RNA polymerase sigma-70 factor (ECF subfamily)
MERFSARRYHWRAEMVLNSLQQRVSKSDDPFCTIWHLHAEALVERARFLARNREVAEDLVQSVFERALRAGCTRIPPNKRRGWLMVILHNLYIDEVRSACARPRVNLELDSLCGADESSAVEPRWMTTEPQLARQSLAGLPDRFRVPVEMWLQGMSYRAIAAHLDVRVSTVGTRIHRACRLLRRLIDAPSAATD